MRVTREIDIAAPPETIHAVIMDPSRLADWVSIHQSLDEAPDSLREGSTLTQTLTLAGRSFEVRWRVVENEPPERVVWDGQGPMRSKAKVIYQLTRKGDGTHFIYTNEYDLPGGPLGRIAGPAVRRLTAGELDRSLAQLKLLVE